VEIQDHVSWFNINKDGFAARISHEDVHSSQVM
jgi:hypothetical protein